MCNPGWSKFENTCFKLFTDLKTWAASEQACVGEGGHLASTANEIRYYGVLSLLDLTGNTCQWQQSVGQPYESYTAWIGLNHINNTVTSNITKNGWEWTDGSSYNYINPFFILNWFKLIQDYKQPDNVYYHKCGHMIRHDNTSRGWGDYGCNLQLCRICQAPTTQGIL